MKENVTQYSDVFFIAFGQQWFSIAQRNMYTPTTLAVEKQFIMTYGFHLTFLYSAVLWVVYFPRCLIYLVVFSSATSCSLCSTISIVCPHSPGLSSSIIKWQVWLPAILTFRCRGLKQSSASQRYNLSLPSTVTYDLKDKLNTAY